MREWIARAVCLLAVVAAIGLSLLFAARHNRSADLERASVVEPVPVTETTPATEPVTPARTQRGREVFEEQRCLNCHSIAGTGNPRNPLEGVAARLDAGELRAWITGTGAAAESLAPAVAKRKQRYLELPANDMDALLEYMATLTER